MYKNREHSIMNPTYSSPRQPSTCSQPCFSYTPPTFPQPTLDYFEANSRLHIISFITSSIYISTQTLKLHRSGVKSRLSHLLAVRPWAIDFTSLSLSSICKMGIVMLASQDCNVSKMRYGI